MPTPAGSPGSPLRIDLGNHVGVELRRSGTAQISLGETAVRNLAGKGSGTIKLSDLWAKSNYASFRPASDLFDVVLTPQYVYGPFLAGYQAGSTSIDFNINAGTGVYSTDPTKPALTVSGWTTGDRVKITNNGTIRGRGGAGGRGDQPGSSGAIGGGAGGTALKVDFAIELDNNGVIAGGGGGGGGGGGWVRYNFWGFLNQNDGSYGGGGGGGGAGSYVGPAGTFVGSAGAGGIAYAQELRTPGNSGANGTATAGGAGGGAPGGGTGGAGGTLGAAGGNGGGGNSTGGATGGRAGYSIEGTNRVTYIRQGTLTGPTLA